MKNIKDYVYKVNYDYISTKKNEKKRDKKYDHLSPQGRRYYFNDKIGEEIQKMRDYLDKNTFIAYFVAPKMAGKGTYTRMIMEIIGEKYFANISVGDVVRAAHADYEAKGNKSDTYLYVKDNYRGLMSVDELFDTLVGRTAEKTLPTELILSLIKKEIDQQEHKSIFLDGFPRKADQVSYSLYFRDLIDYRNDPDIFVLINIAMEVIDERIKTRRICPKCGNSRNLTLNPTSDIRYDEESKDFYLMCDNPSCEPTRLIPKENDDKGIGIIEDRILTDLELADMTRRMHGITRIELYNCLDADLALDYVDEDELTKVYSYEEVNGEVEINTEKFTIDDHGKKLYSLIPDPVVIQFIKQFVDILL